MMPAKKFSVFIAEDDMIIRMLVCDMLNELGFAIANEAGNLNEAIAIVGKSDFDCALLDFNLGGSLVTPVANILRQRGIPFAFTTGYGAFDLPKDLLATRTLQKPYELDALRDVMAALQAITAVRVQSDGASD